MFAALWLLLAWVATAAPGNQIVLVLDNSCSMVAGATVQGTGEQLPPNDPDRAAVLGALLVDGLARGSEDQVVVIGFGDADGAPPKIVQGADAIRAMPYAGGTWFAPALRASADKLRASTANQRVLVFFTDGAPSDLQDPAEGPKLLDGIKADRIAIGLYGGTQARDQGTLFLRPLVDADEDLVLLDATSRDVVAQVVRAFTQAYARVLGSKPLVGSLQPQGSQSFQVSRYVTEVMVTVASESPGPAFQARLVGPKGEVPARASGDNGCPPAVVLGNAPKVCDPPRRHYQVFRGASDPYAPATWTLDLPQAPGRVEYGIILRYDLHASLELPATTKVGEPVAVGARLLFRGETFVDQDFFTADDFRAVLEVGGQTVTLEHAGNGLFRGTWTPTAPGTVEARVSFANTWLDARADAQVLVEGFLDLNLQPNPNPIELGTWRGERGETRACAEVDLSASLNADRVPVRCIPDGQSAAVLTCGPIPGSEADLGGSPGQPLRWEVCVIAAGCCGDLPGPDDRPFTITLRGAHDHYASGAVTVPVRFQVEPTGWWRCWWVEIVALLTVLTLGWLLYGFLSPYDFDPAATVRIAGSPAALRRASALVLCEQPGGRRGFYRHARMALAEDGTPVRTVGTARLIIEAGPGARTRFRKAPGLERMDRRTRAWQPVDDEAAAAGFDTGVVYRVGNLYMTFG